MSPDAIKTVEYKGYSISIYQDDASESPREMDNLGKIALFHKGYSLPNEEGISIEQAQRIERDKKRYLSLPVYGYDHGMLTISTSPYSCSWDSGKLGIIYVSREDARKEYGRLYSKKALNLLNAEIKVYNQYLIGEVYGYKITDPSGNETDSCWGFYGDYEGELMCQAKSIIDYTEKQSLPLLAYAGLVA